MRAHGRESHNHEMPLSRRLAELMSVMQADDPDTVAQGPYPRAHGIQVSMRRAEIQKKGNFGRWEVPLLNRYAQVARTREVAVDIGAKAGIGRSLQCLPLPQFGSVFADFDRRFHSTADAPQRSRLRCHRPSLQIVTRSTIAVNSFLIPSILECRLGRQSEPRRSGPFVQALGLALSSRGERMRASGRSSALL